MPTLGELFTQVINQRVTTTAMADAIANINSMEIHVCTAGEYNSTTLVPTVATPDASTFYLVPDGSGNNLYTEWVYVNNTWELFGRATIDLSGYALKTEIPDIRVGGNSVVNNGVANVPYATADVPGVVKVAYGNGIAVDSENARLYINRADDSLIKAGTSDLRPIVPANQHQSVFFGLSKLAGVDLAGQTVTVGTYPATSKAAIRSLIGAIATDDLDIQVKADTPVTITFGSATINDDNNVPNATMDATAFEEGLATLVIGTDEIPVHMALTTDNETGKTYYMTTEMLQDGTTPVFAAQYTGTAGTSTTVSYMAYSDETYAEAQTIALKYPRSKLTAQMPKMYLGTAADGSGGYMVATTDYLETNYAPKNNPVFTGMISLGRNSIYGAGINSIAVGDQVLAQATDSAAFGIFSQAASKYSFAANRGTYASGESSAAFGFKARANGEASFAEGFWTYAGGQYAHVEGEANGVNNQANSAYGANGRASHAEGGFTLANAGYAHAEGHNTRALATASHTEGDSTIASGYASHAQGYQTNAGFANQSASGLLNAIDNHKTYPKWAANTSYAVGDRVLYDEDDNTSTDGEDYAVFECRVANNDATFDKTNWYYYDYDMGNFVEIVGNGKWGYDGETYIENRSNARALDWDGNEYLMGDIYVGCNADSSGGTKLARIPAPSQGDQDKVLKGDGTWANMVSDSLSDTSTTNALSAAKGKALNDSVASCSQAIAKNAATITVLARHTRLTDFSLSDLQSAVAEQNLAKYGLRPGDKKTINNYDYFIAGLNVMKGTHAYTCTSDHCGLIVVPHATCIWNASGSTTKTSDGSDDRGGGYKNCDLHKYLVDTVLPHVQNDLGSNHLYSHKKLLSKAVNTTGYNRFGTNSGCSSGWEWVDCYISALTEAQVCGGDHWSSSGYDTGEANTLLPIFADFKHTDIFGNEQVWLRNVSSARQACVADALGYVSGNYGVRDVAYVAGLILYH